MVAISHRNDDSALREKVRKAIQGGQIPDRGPDRVLGGQGGGAACALCRAQVTSDEVELELEFTTHGERARLDTFHVHVRCFAVWRSERHTASSGVP